jgi:hypothetical protein
MSDKTRRAAEEIAQMVEEVSRISKGPRFMFEEFIAEVDKTINKHVEGEAAPAPQAATPKNERRCDYDACWCHEQPAPRTTECVRCNQPITGTPVACHRCDGPLCGITCEEWHLEKDCPVSQAEAPLPSDELAMLKVKYDQLCDWYCQLWERLTIAESRPSVEEVERLAREWIKEYSGPPFIRGIEALAAFYQWMQERITR